MKSFQSCFAERLRTYVALRRNLGFKFQVQANVLRAFDRYAYDQGHVGTLTEDLVLGFTTEDPIASADKRARRYQVIRHFADDLATFDPQTPALQPRLFRRPKTHPPAYIYAGDELDHLLTEARRVSRRHPLRGVTLHAMFGLAASTGLRRGEVVRLDKADVDLQTGVLFVRQTKFAKDRLVPVHPTTLEVLQRYAVLRDAHLGDNDCSAFFLNMRRQRYAAHTLHLNFAEVCRRAGLVGAEGRRPRFHDLRHSFAVRRLATWYREGADVQAMLPVLATYMGHVHYSDTAYYLRAAAELLGLAAERFECFLPPEEVAQ
jgi:integrase